MKKLLLIALVLIGVNSAIFAQNTAKKEQVAAKTTKTDTIAATVLTKAVSIESISEKIDQFVDSQNETNEKLEQKIDRANKRMQDLQNQSSLRWLFRDMIPILVMGIIGAFIVVIVYTITNSNYRINVLKYETLVKCTERTGSIPDFFNKVERQRSSIVPVSGRVHLVLAIICGIMAIIFLLVSINMNNANIFTRMLSIFGMGIFIIATFLLFKQYNQISENSRKEQ